jgi:amino acid transporter
LRNEEVLAMTAQAASSTTTPSLRRNALDLPQVVFQGITHIAPSINVVFTFPVIALKAGPDMPISFLLTTIVCVFIANTVSQFSRYLPSSGGYYSFATRGLGARPGFMTTWSYLIYDIIGPAGAIGFMGYLASTTIQQATGTDVPWWIFALAFFAIVWGFTHYGIRLSMRTTAIFGGIEILIMLALAFTFLAHPGHGTHYSAPLIPNNSPHHYGGILAGMVFSVLALSGFEAPAPLAQETRRPGSFISRAVMLSLLLIGAFYVFTSYASAIGWGTGNMAAFASNANPYYLLGHTLWGAGWWFIFVALINSAVACGLACTNAASRVAYTMGQAGTLPPRFGKIHPVHRTPTFAIAVQQSLGIIAILIVGLALAPGDIFAFLGTITTLAVIVLYIMANFALTAYILREHREDYNVWKHLVLPGIGTLALLPVLWTTVYPYPAWPINLTPYLFIAALIVGAGYMIWLERRHPGALQRGATELVGRTTDKQGDVDWDAATSGDATQAGA